MRSILLKLFILGVLVSSGRATSLNDFCPVTPEEPIEIGITRNYQGREIGFCCKRCLRKFNQDPEAYLINLEPPNQHASISEHQRPSPSIQPVPHPQHQSIEQPHNHSAAEPHAHLDEVTHHDPEPHSPIPDSPRAKSTTPEPENGHNHATDRGSTDTSTGQSLGQFLGKFHVLLVHLPIGLLSFAVIFELIGWWKRISLWSTVSRFNFVAGAVSAILAASLGWLAAANANYPEDLQSNLQWHRWLGITTASLGAIGLMLIYWERRTALRKPRLYWLVLALITIALPLAAHFGGSLIYGPDYLFG